MYNILLSDLFFRDFIFMILLSNVLMACFDLKVVKTLLFNLIIILVYFIIYNSIS